MKRFGMTIGLNPGCADIYRRYHGAVWPEVLEKISDCNVENYSIFPHDDTLFGYFEHYGSDPVSPLGQEGRS